MRRSTIINLWPVLGLTLMACVLPMLAAGMALLGAQVSVDERVSLHTRAELLITTFGWSLLVAILAMVLGWLPGRAIGDAMRSGRSRTRWFAVLCIVPVCLPAYTIFWCWWQAWPGGSWLHQWAFDRELIREMRLATLLLALVCWSWPLVAWCVAALRDSSAEPTDVLRVDGARRRDRLHCALRRDGRGLLIGGGIVALLTFNNTTCFDLAEVFTFGNELRAMEALGASTGEVARAAIPAVIIALLGVVLVWMTLFRCGDQPQLSTGDPRIGWAAVVVCAISMIVPVLLLGRGIGMLFSQGGTAEVAEFVDLYGSDLGGSMLIALVVAVLVSLLAVATGMLWDSETPRVRLTMHAIAVVWLAMAVVPATLVVVGYEAAFNRPLLSIDDAIYGSSVGLVMALTARFGFVGVILGRWLATREPESLRAVRRIDGVSMSVRAMLAATRHRWVPVAIASMAISIVLVMSEIPVTALLRAPSTPVITPAVLNAMHYQQPYTVMLVVGFFVIVALAVSIGVWHVLWRGRRHLALAASCLAIMVVIPGCDRDEEAPLLDVEYVFGSPGRGPGQFSYPRAIATDPDRGFVYVIDKSARVQRFSLDGEQQLSWAMPAKEFGKPTGMNVGPDGSVYVADTHYHRIIKYAPDGTELLRFGEYGEGPGQFIYPTDVEFGPDGLLYVSEYGGNDRIQVFTSEGQPVREFGRFGSEPGCFNRPQSIAFTEDHAELYIADACNHRIVVTNRDGEVLRMFGEAGKAIGQLAYPYDVEILADGSLLVCEFGNNRVQRFSPEGESMGVFGRLGFDVGQLQYPWGVDAIGSHVFVLDSGNNRVQVTTMFD